MIIFTIKLYYLDMRVIFGLLFISILVSCDNKENEPLSNDFRDITNQLSIQDFEKIKMLILDSGIYEPFCNMYEKQPVYSFGKFSATLLPEVGQLNITCDPQISDFNKLVIYDSDLQSRYIHFLIIRQGDKNKANIEIPDYAGLKENKVYLIRYYDYNLDEMFDKSLYYITQMKSKVE